MREPHRVTDLVERDGAVHLLTQLEVELLGITALELERFADDRVVDHVERVHARMVEHPLPLVGARVEAPQVAHVVLRGLVT